MRLFIELDSGKIVLAQGTNSELSSVSVKRSPNAEFQVQFFRLSLGTSPIELGVGATGKMEIKEVGKYDANAIAAALSWVKTGTGSDTVYTFTLDLQSQVLNDFLNVNADPPIEFTANVNDTLTAASAHGLAAGNIVQFASDDTLPAPLLPNTDYYVISSGLGTLTFKVSTTLNGSAVDITSAGTGTHTFARTDDDLDDYTFMAAIEWTDAGKTNETQTIDFVLVNDVCREADNTVPPTPAPTVLNLVAGVEDLSLGDESKPVSFDTPFDSGGTICVVAGVSKPSTGGDNVFPIVVEDATDETGFTVEFTNPIPASGHKLHWFALRL